STAIPSEIKNLINLKNLNLSENKLDELSLEHICNLGASLEILDLSYMDIIVLPKNLSKLKNLKELNLSGNKKLQADNKEFKGIYKLKNLKKLEIRGCESLKPLPEKIRAKIEETFENDFDLIE